MSEAMQDNAQGGAATPVEVVPLPEQITSDDFNSIVEQNRVERGEVPAPKPEEAVSEVETPSPFMEGEEEPAAVGIDQKVSQMENALKALAHIVVQQKQTNGEDPNATPASVMEDGLSEMAPNDPQGAKELSRIFREEINNVMNEKIAPLNEQLGTVQGIVAQGASERIRDEYNTHLDGLLNHLKVEDGWDRDALKAQVTTEGTQKFGKAFNLQNAGQLLREKNNTRLRSRHAENLSETTAAENDANNTPPVQSPQTGNTVATTIRDQVKNPANKAMDFRGGDFQKVVRQWMSHADDALTGA